MSNINSKDLNICNDITSSNFGCYQNRKEVNQENVTGGKTSNNNQGLNYFYELPRNINVLSKIKGNFGEITNQEIRKSILDFVLTFQNLLISFNSVTEIKNYLPPLMFNNLVDGSVLLEWVFKDFRVGFAFETDNNESSWYLVANKNLEEASMSGLLRGSELKSLLNKLIVFVLRNT